MVKPPEHSSVNICGMLHADLREPVFCELRQAGASTPIVHQPARTAANNRGTSPERIGRFAGVFEQRRTSTTLWICLHTAEVAGSNPASPTQKPAGWVLSGLAGPEVVLIAACWTRVFVLDSGKRALERDPYHRLKSPLLVLGIVLGPQRFLVSGA